MIWARYTCSWRRYGIASCRQMGTMVMLTELVGFTHFQDFSWTELPCIKLLLVLGPKTATAQARKGKDGGKHAALTKQEN